MRFFVTRQPLATSSLPFSVSLVLSCYVLCYCYSSLASSPYSRHNVKEIPKFTHTYKALCTPSENNKATIASKITLILLLFGKTDTHTHTHAHCITIRVRTLARAVFLSFYLGDAPCNVCGSQVVVDENWICCSQCWHR